MDRKILILLLVLTSFEAFAKIGANVDFWILSENEYNDRMQKGKDVVLRRYVVVPGIDKAYKDILETTDEKALLAKFSFMVQKNKGSLVEKYINSCDHSLDINNLIKGLYFFSENQYLQAITHLKKVEDDGYLFLKQLLIADCQYEMLHDKKNYKSIMGGYQVAMDATNHEQNKSIINNRIKYIKYH